MHIQTSSQEKLELGFGGYTCNWGAHICALYDTEKERDELVNSFFKKGVLNGDMILYASNEEDQKKFGENFGKCCPDCSGKIEDKNHVQTFSSEDLYYPKGKFSPDDMMDGLNDFFKETQKDGKRNVRGIGNLDWALEKIPGSENLMVYESKLNEFIEGKPWISICMYDINQFSGRDIMNVLKTHPYSICGGVIAENPYYVEPKEWLAENAPDHC